MSRLSRGNVPIRILPRTFCPIYVDLHRSQLGTSRMSLGLFSKSSPRRFGGISTTKSLYVCFVYRFFLLPSVSAPRSQKRVRARFGRFWGFWARRVWETLCPTSPPVPLRLPSEGDQAHWNFECMPNVIIFDMTLDCKRIACKQGIYLRRRVFKAWKALITPPRKITQPNVVSSAAICEPVVMCGLRVGSGA